MFCNKCGNKIVKENAIYCNFCGNKLIKSSDITNEDTDSFDRTVCIKPTHGPRIDSNIKSNSSSVTKKQLHSSETKLKQEEIKSQIASNAESDNKNLRVEDINQDTILFPFSSTLLLALKAIIYFVLGFGVLFLFSYLFNINLLIAKTGIGGGVIVVAISIRYLSIGIEAYVNSKKIAPIITSLINCHEITGDKGFKISKNIITISDFNRIEYQFMKKSNAPLTKEEMEKYCYKLNQLLASSYPCDYMFAIASNSQIEIAKNVILKDNNGYHLVLKPGKFQMPERGILD